VTNFLDRLAGRTLGITPVVQPIVPPMTSAVTRPDSVGTAEAPVEIARAESEIAGPDAPEAAAPPSSPHYDAELAERWPLPFHRRPTVPEQIPFRALSPVEPVSVAATVTAFPTQVRGKQSELSVREDEHRTENQAATMVRSEARIDGGEPMRGTVAPLLRQVLEPALQVTPGPVPLNGRINSFPAPTAPMIRVTIGRVDVRAEFPPSAPPRPPARSKAASPLSLEEYSRQRSEGRR
jgi:hypothetical protein